MDFADAIRWCWWRIETQLGRIWIDITKILCAHCWNLDKIRFVLIIIEIIPPGFKQAPRIRFRLIIMQVITPGSKRAHITIELSWRAKLWSDGIIIFQVRATWTFTRFRSYFHSIKWDPWFIAGSRCSMAQYILSNLNTVLLCFGLVVIILCHAHREENKLKWQKLVNTFRTAF